MLVEINEQIHNIDGAELSNSTRTELIDFPFTDFVQYIKKDYEDKYEKLLVVPTSTNSEYKLFNEYLDDEQGLITVLITIQIKE